MLPTLAKAVLTFHDTVEFFNEHGFELLVITVIVTGSIVIWRRWLGPKITGDLNVAAQWAANHGMQILTVVLLIVAIHMMYSRIIPPDAGWMTIGGSLLPWLYALKAKVTGQKIDEHTTTLNQQNQTLDWQNQILSKLMAHVGQPVPSASTYSPSTSSVLQNRQAPPPGSPAAAEAGNPQTSGQSPSAIVLGGPKKSFD